MQTLRIQFIPCEIDSMWRKNKSTNKRTNKWTIVRRIKILRCTICRPHVCNSLLTFLQLGLRSPDDSGILFFSLYKKIIDFIVNRMDFLFTVLLRCDINLKSINPIHFLDWTLPLTYYLTPINTHDSHVFRRGENEERLWRWLRFGIFHSAICSIDIQKWKQWFFLVQNN